MIEFQTYDVPMPTIDAPRLRRWLEAVAKAHGFELGSLSYQFCSDEHILEVNRKFLGHDYFTDIITFQYERGRHLCGDMVISLDTVRTNADGVGESFRRELHRVIVHGLLHLCGINDKGPGEREIMEAHEDQALALLDTIK